MKSVPFDLGPSLHKDYLKWGAWGFLRRAFRSVGCFPNYSLYFMGFSLFFLT